MLNHRFSLNGSDSQPLFPALSCWTLAFHEEWWLSTSTAKSIFTRLANLFSDSSGISPYLTADDSKSTCPHVRYHFSFKQPKTPLVLSIGSNISLIIFNHWKNVSLPLDFTSHFEQDFLSWSVHVALSFRVRFSHIKVITFANWISFCSFMISAAVENPSALAIVVSNLPEEQPQYLCAAIMW